ncbi:hypothetical protein ACQEVZ_60665 [Dactylosporangium sp. CA-152071]|uniref:hypothetical protein n=1 Tax=Dactylosporangium sp. CA-152071 TaxID=3239933 RepID=UPI003D8F9FBE
MTDDADIRATIRELAAVTDAELVAEVLAAAAAVHSAVEVWQAAPAWREDGIGQRIRHTVAQTRAALELLEDRPGRDDVAAAVDAVRPLLSAWWPTSPEPHAPAVVVAVEQLRAAAMHRAPAVRQARELAAGYDRHQDR